MHSGVGEDDDEADATEGLLMVETTNKCYQRTPPSEGAPSTIETFVHSVEGSVEDCGVSSGSGRVLYHGSDRLLMKADGSNIDLESYHNSPRKYKQLPMNSKEKDMFSEYVEQDVGLPGLDEQVLSGSGDQWRFVRGYYHNGATPVSGAIAIPRPEPAQCYIREQTPPPVGASATQQEILTTRVCVELGVITTPRQLVDRQGDDGGPTLEAPAIVLCSVDVEPCHRSVLELAEMTASVDTSACRMNGGPSIIASEEEQTTKEAIKSDIDNSQPDGQEISPQRTDIKEEIPCSSVERKQPEGREKPQPVISVTPSTEAEEDMMDRISHDLDYLLNRKPPQNNGSALSVPTFTRKTSKPPATSVRSQIEEEEEEETSAIPGESVTSENITGKS